MPDLTPFALQIAALSGGTISVAVILRWLYKIGREIEGIVDTVRELRTNGGTSVKDKIDSLYLNFNQHLRDHEAAAIPQGAEITD